MDIFSKECVTVSHVFACIKNVGVPHFVDIMAWYKHILTVATQEKKCLVLRLNHTGASVCPSFFSDQLEFDVSQIKVLTELYEGA